VIFVIVAAVIAAVFSFRNDRYVPELGRASAFLLAATLLGGGATIVWPGLFYWVALLFLSWIVISTVLLVGVLRERGRTGGQLGGPSR
jgi:hypothetical protein